MSEPGGQTSGGAGTVSAVLRFISERTGVSAIDVATARLVELPLDSLDYLELVMVLDELGCVIPLEAFATIESVDDILRYELRSNGCVS